MTKLEQAFADIRDEINTLSTRLYSQSMIAQRALPTHSDRPIEELVRLYRQRGNAVLRLETQIDTLRSWNKVADERLVTIEKYSVQIRELRRELTDARLEASEWGKEAKRVTDLLVGCVPFDLTDEQKTEYKEILGACFLARRQEERLEG